MIFDNLYSVLKNVNILINSSNKIPVYKASTNSNIIFCLHRHFYYTTSKRNTTVLINLQANVSKYTLV